MIGAYEIHQLFDSTLSDPALVEDQESAVTLIAIKTLSLVAQRSIGVGPISCDAIRSRLTPQVSRFSPKRHVCSCAKVTAQPGGMRLWRLRFDDRQHANNAGSSVANRD